jgi:DNA helicase-2/ATP-dependent DNA helicase PcrA
VVFIVGLNDGTLPHSRSFDDPDGMQEERRLLYVGITRAKDRLYLLHAQNRSLYGYSEESLPSRFLDDIPARLLDDEQPQRSRRSPGGSYSSYREERREKQERWEPAMRAPGPAPQAKPQVEQRYTPGMRVQHNVWGPGMVLNSRIQDDDETVDIFFEAVGLKRVAASLAKLEIIKK